MKVGRLLVPLLFLAALAAVSCGETASSLDQPATRDSGVVPGAFAALPEPGAATPLGEPTVDGRTSAQSFRVEGLSVQEILGFYEVQLGQVGWIAARLPNQVGDGDWQGLWGRGNESLQLRVSPYGDDEPTTTQVDLVLVQ